MASKNPPPDGLLAHMIPLIAKEALEESDRVFFPLYSVQVLGNHVRLRRHDGKPVVAGWDEIQAELHEAVGPEACLIEVFPPLDDVVDDANVRHFWVVHPDVLIGCDAWLRRRSFRARGGMR